MLSRFPIRSDRIDVLKVSLSTCFHSINVSRYEFDAAVLTVRYMDSVSMFWRVSEWLRDVGTSQVSRFDFMRFVDLYRFDLKSSALTVGYNESIWMICVTGGWPGRHW